MFQQRPLGKAKPQPKLSSPWSEMGRAKDAKFAKSLLSFAAFSGFARHFLL
jgi:hypothetical protein